MKFQTPISFISITIFILSSTSLFTHRGGGGAHAIGTGSDSTPNGRVVQVEIQDYGTVELTLDPSSAHSMVPLPNVDIVDAEVRSEGPTTCFFHKWPEPDWPKYDRSFASIPLRTDGVTADAFRIQQFKAAERVYCYDSTDEWNPNRITTTLLYQQGDQLSLQSIDPLDPERPRSTMYVDYRDERNNPDGETGLRLDAAAFLFPARDFAHCTFWYNLDDFPPEVRSIAPGRALDRKIVSYTNALFMEPDKRIRLIDCLHPWP